MTQLNITTETIWSHGVKTIEDTWVDLCVAGVITVDFMLEVSKKSHDEQLYELKKIKHDKGRG